LYSERGSRPDVFNPEYDPDISVNLKYIEFRFTFHLGTGGKKRMNIIKYLRMQD
jgi:hypothetical protein